MKTDILMIVILTFGAILATAWHRGAIISWCLVGAMILVTVYKHLKGKQKINDGG